MAKEMKGTRGIRTMARLVDGRRVRTPAGALLELSSLANEKQLLQREMERWCRRHVEIETRLNEIDAKERRLMAIVAGQVPAGDGAPREGTAAKTQAAAAATATAVPSDRKFKVQEISY